MVGKKGQHKKVLEKIKREGFVRVMIDGNLRDIAEDIELDKNLKHDIFVVVDRIVVKKGYPYRSRKLHMLALTKLDNIWN